MSDISGVHTSASAEQDIAIIEMSCRRVKFDVISGRSRSHFNIQRMPSVGKKTDELNK